MRVELVLAALLLGAPLAGCLSSGEEIDPTSQPANNSTREAEANQSEASNASEAEGNRTVSNTTTEPELENTTGEDDDGDDAGPRPHVVVGLPDTGVNPYHEIYHRPDLTEHPCTYIPDYPCDVPALDLSVGMDDYEAAVQEDAEEWATVEPGEWYWIPQTSLIAVGCSQTHTTDDNDTCILGDTSDHGTSTSSSVLTENPEALIAFKEGRSSIAGFQEAGIPVDVYSVSWGSRAPIPSDPDLLCPGFQNAEIYVTAAGNDPRSTLADCQKGHPGLITVAGAYADPDSSEAQSARNPEVVSYFCRPTAPADATTGMDEGTCGTSVSAPTVAGALSAVILETRRTSGYAGTVQEGLVDPRLNVTVQDLRASMNQTATYDPDARYEGSAVPVPRNPATPWVDWGWGFVDAQIVDRTVQHLLAEDDAQLKADEAQTYMETQHQLKRTLYG